MAVIRSIVTSRGAVVNIRDEGYAGAAGDVLLYRREEILNTAVRIAQEAEQRRQRLNSAGQELHDEKL
ncbi:MAG: hypothetical protein J6A19_09185 [Oscillospiraceae bacterium]|nr:hypothetical protein [Oscillospiraceae bacterium]